METSHVSLSGNESISVRLYVGGLGPSVTIRDLESTFAALGHVSSVNIIRTKGRNFAYMNFQAASPHHLQRFFSLYNGCMWKGGRLKLEKAREHYVDKLHREWGDRDCSTEPSETITSTPDPPCSTKKLSTLEKSKGLKIFFPKSRLVKTIPQKGLGKHKRSFERVDSIPCSFLQLCDCKQCCMDSSYQNKLMLETFELAGENNRKVWTKTQEKESKSTDAIGSKDHLKKCKMDSPMTKKQIIWSDARKVNAERTVGEPELNEPVMKVTARAKRKFCQAIENMNDNEKGIQKSLAEPMPNIPPKKLVPFDLEINECFRSESKETSQKHDGFKEGEKGTVQADLATETPLESSKLHNATDTVWLQKASWKTLVGETDRINFKLSNILGRSIDSSPAITNNRDDAKLFSSKSPSVSFSQQPVPMTSELKAQSAKINSQSIPESEAQNSSVVQCKSLKAVPKRHEGTDFISKCSPWIQWGSEETSKQLQEVTLEQCKLESAQPTNLKTTSSMEDGNDKVCVFMRSANSEQEWFESKQIVKGIMKRSRKDALRSMKILRTSKQNY